MSRKHRADILALAAYFFLAVVLTYPLILNFATHVAGDGSDDPALTWNLWWVPHAIINLDSSPIYTQHMFYPIGLNLAYYTLTYLNAFLSIPIQYAFNLIVAANVNLLLSFALGGFGAYLLVKFIIRNTCTLHRALGACVRGKCSKFEIQDAILGLSAFSAGALYAFSSNKLLYASLGQFNIASSHWIPFYVLFLLKLTNTRHSTLVTRHGFCLGLFLLFQALSEFIYASFLIVCTLLFMIYWVFTNRRRLHEFRLLPFAFLLGGVVFLLPMSPILAALIQDMTTEGDFIQRGLGFADVFSNDVYGFFVPSRLHPFLNQFDSQFHFAYINFAYLGFTALVLALIALWQVPRARPWGLGFGIFVLITLGPALRVNGERFDAPFLPFNLLLEIPFIKGNRYPSRWSVMVTLCLAVIVGFGVVWLLKKVNSHQSSVNSRRRVLLVTVYCSLITVLLFEHLSIPLPISNLQSPELYQTIARDPGDFTVLEIPLAWRNGFRMTGTLDQVMMFAQFFQTVHRRPILGGNTSRNPESKFQYFTEAPVINSIIAAETGHTLSPVTLRADKELAPVVLNLFSIRYVVWHSPRNPQNRPALDVARAYVENILPVKKFYEVSDEGGETVAYRVNELSEQIQTTIRPNDPLARLNFAEGWGTVGGERIWATRREAKIFWRMDSPHDTAVSLRAFAPMPNQRVTMKVNGRGVGLIAMKQGWGEYGLEIRDWRLGMNEIVLQFDALAPVISVRESSFVIGATGVTSPISIGARSAGSEVGDFAHIFANGVDQSPNERGYNFVVIDRQTGAIDSRESFDTFASESESARLARFVRDIPNGKIVAVAVRDEASRALTADAVAALRSIGATQDLREKFRWSHAIIGIKGAAPDSALEFASETFPAQVVVGVGAMEPSVAAAVEWIKIEQK